MTRGNVRRLGAGALVLGCLVALPGTATADGTQTLSVAAVSANEDTGTLTFTVALEAGPDSATFDYATANGSALAGSDYTATSATGATVAAGASVTIQVPLTVDDRNAPNESFALNISNIVDAANTSVSATGIILNDDAVPSVAIQGTNASPEEGVAATFTISLTGTSESPVSVTYAPENVTATQGTDYTLASGSVAWAAGQTGDKPALSVPTTEDTTDEVDETFKVNLSAPENASLGNASATGTITDDDAEVSVGTVSDVTVAEGNSGTVDASITVTLSAPSGKTVTVPYTTAPLSATEGTDYEQKSGDYIFAPGDVSETVVFKVKGDTVFEQEEKFSVVLTDPTNGAPGTDMRGEVTITDDESTPTPTVTNPSVLEGNSGLTDLVFEASLAAPHPAVTFNFRTAIGSANGSDFETVSGSKLFPANSSTAPGAATKVPITIKVKGDLLDELDETMTLELLNATTDAIVATGTGTIRNDDNNSKLSVNDASADEPGTMRFTVTLAPASEREVKVNWATANGTAIAGVDYTAGSGVLTFAPGETSKTIDVAITGDSLDEANETLSVNLSSPTGIPPANVLDGQGAGTIVDKNAPPSLSISDTTGREGAGATFTVTLAGTTLQEVKVNFNTADGTAKAGSDYASRGGTLTFAPGETTKTVAVSIVDDPDSEPLETFFVVLGDPVSAAITKNRGEGSIEASDRSLTPEPPAKPPVAKPTTVLVPRMILGPRLVSVGANGIAKMLVTCQKASPIGCAGTVELERAVKPLLKLGKKTFTVKKGAKGYASIKLTARALKLLRKNGTLRAKVIVMVKTSAKTMKVSPGIITLKRTKALMKAKPKPAAPPTKVVVDP